jgi:hypothetical protein
VVVIPVVVIMYSRFCIGASLLSDAYVAASIATALATVVPAGFDSILGIRVTSSAPSARLASNVRNLGYLFSNPSFEIIIPLNATTLAPSFFSIPGNESLKALHVQRYDDVIYCVHDGAGVGGLVFGDVRQQAAGSMQAASSKQQTAGSRQQATGSRQQATGYRLQAKKVIGSR